MNPTGHTAYRICGLQKEGAEMNDYLEKEAIGESLKGVKHRIFVLSGKGGVGKSTVAVNTACGLARKGYRVGLLDIDIHGPSVPKLLNIENEKFEIAGNVIHPICMDDGLKVVSVGFLLDNADNAVIWRGPRKFGIIKQFLKDVEWGDLDYLIVDSPPGTGDEPLAVCQLIQDPDGALIVTTPQELAIVDVRKAVTFCRSLNIDVLGVVENMSTFVCPHCGERVDIFKSGGGRVMAETMEIPFCVSIPMDPSVVTSGDDGTPYVDGRPPNDTTRAFDALTDFVLSLDSRTTAPTSNGKKDMPIQDGPGGRR